MTIFLNDPDQLRQFRAGDREALARVYWEYVGAVESLLRRGLAALQDASRCRGYSRVDLADLVQEVFIKAFATPARLAYDGVRAYRPLLIAIAHNTLVDHLRAKGRELPVDAATLETLAESWQLQSNAADVWADVQTMRIVESYLEGLGARERDVYIQADAAKAVGLSRQNIRTIEARLRDGLARKIRCASLCPPGIVVAPPDEPRIAAPVVVEIDKR
jgi:RNA polymerase sigma factor (sigma-70 family)